MADSTAQPTAGQSAEPVASTDVPTRAKVSLGATVAVLVASNVYVNLALPTGWYIPWNLSVALAIVGISTGVGRLALVDLGLGATQASTGLRWGGAIGGIVMVIILLAAILPGTRNWFIDDLGRQSTSDLLVHIFVMIPLGTVIMEELAFRGCLLANLDAVVGSARHSTAISAVLFGLWHVLPSRGLGARNETLGSVASGGLGQWIPVVAAILATTAAGVALVWLRRRSDSVIAPMLVHFALNAAGTAATWAALR